jgi:hypothetical protein
VLAVDLDMVHDYGERVTVARIHAKAWEDAGPLVRMVRLTWTGWLRRAGEA